MSSKLVLVILMSQTWLWSTMADSEDLTGQCDFKMFTSENSIVTVSLKICEPSQCNGVFRNRQHIEVQGHVMNTMDCEAVIKINRTQINMIPCDLQTCSRVCPTTPSTPNTTTPFMQTTAQSSSTMKPQCSAITAPLGVMVGLLVVSAALLTVALVWTCSIMKKRGKIIKQLNTRLNGINQISNPQYGEDMSTSWHQNASLIPTYETIPDRQTAVSTTELKEHGYDVLHEATPKKIHRDAKDQRRSSEKESSIESSSRYTLKLTQMEESDQGRVEIGKSGYDARYSRGQTETEKGIKRDRTNTDQENLAAKASKEEDSAGRNEDKCITEGVGNGETGSTTSEHNYFCLEESVKVNSDDHQQENCDMVQEREGHRRDSAPPKGAAARDYEDFVPSK